MDNNFPSFNITLLSTVHKEFGKCNSEELYKIIETINPNVIFLEELEENYTAYDHLMFSKFRIFSNRLEQLAIQVYRHTHNVKYVPVLDIGLSEEVVKRAQIAKNHGSYQRLLENFESLVINCGFDFLNSPKCIDLHDEMRELEFQIIEDEFFHQKVNDSIHEYENSMLRNIYSFSKVNSFNKAIFMCGSAHRKSIIEKIEYFNIDSDIKLNWSIYNETR